MRLSIDKINKSLCKRVFGYSYQRVAWESIKVATVKTEQEKVTNWDAQSWWEPFYKRSDGC